MEVSELGPGLVERLEQLSTCPLCGGPFQDPVLLACEHSFCRACLASRWGTPPGPGDSDTAPPTVCPCCGIPCPRRSLRSNVRLAVEVRISRGLREKLAEPGARTGRRRGGRIPTMGCQDPHEEDVRKTWRRLETTKPRLEESDEDIPEDYPVVKNMLHRLTGELGNGKSEPKQRLGKAFGRSSSIRKSWLVFNLPLSRPFSFVYSLPPSPPFLYLPIEESKKGNLIYPPAIKESYNCILIR
uniref:Ring finger protein 39 n=1 Tax=Monodelphis domestica TaxID=13616 RepID=A0A5F8G2N9_MONDO